MKHTPAIAPVALSALCLQAATPMHDAIQPYVDSGAIPGLVSMLWKEGGDVQVDCIGWADADKTVPITEHHMFWVASMTKGITAAAILAYADEGKLDLDDPVEKYLPEFKDIRVAEKRDDGTVLLRAPSRPMTLRDCLSHMAGFSLENRMHKQFGLNALPLRRNAAYLAQIPLVRDPGSGYEYTNNDIDTAAAVLEVVAGKPLDRILQERFFDPLGMSDTTFFPNDEQKARLVQAFVVHDGEPCRPGSNVLANGTINPDDRNPEAGGGLFSTPVDMFKFYRMLAAKGVWEGRRILSEKAVETLATRQTPESVPESYSLGIRVRGDWFGHDGARQTEIMCNFKIPAVRLYYVQYVGQWGPESRKAWDKAAAKFMGE